MWLFGKRSSGSERISTSADTGVTLSSLKLRLGLPVQIREFPGKIFKLDTIKYDGIILELPKQLPPNREVELYLDTSFGNSNVPPVKFTGVVVSSVPTGTGFKTYIKYVFKTLEEQSQYYSLLLLFLFLVENS